jgi:predicted ribosome quality control (RQC) complex YloA/Tae2 family protein
MIRDTAIRNIHTNVTAITEGTQALDKNGNVVVLDESKIVTEMTRLQAEYDALQYQRDRQYPPIGDQLDMQYHDELNGTTTWKDAVAKVKADHPKG